MELTDDKLCGGAVWYGPWYTGLIRGHFGHPGKKYHYAMSLGSDNSTVSFNMEKEQAFFPFTTSHSNDAVHAFSKGTLPFGKPQTSFLLFWRLVATKQDLKERFDYQTTLPEEMYRTILREYKQLLERRKHKKGKK